MINNRLGRSPRSPRDSDSARDQSFVNGPASIRIAVNPRRERLGRASVLRDRKEPGRYGAWGGRGRAGRSGMARVGMTGIFSGLQGPGRESVTGRSFLRTDQAVRDSPGFFQLGLDFRESALWPAARSARPVWLSGAAAMAVGGP